jgi:hypothetical protein
LCLYPIKQIDRVYSCVRQKEFRNNEVWKISSQIEHAIATLVLQWRAVNRKRGAY